MNLIHQTVAPIASVSKCPISHNLTVWIGEFESQEALPKEFAVGGQGFRRLLDHFHLPAVPDTDLSVALFSLCAEAYERLVDVARNIAGIHNLLRVAISARSTEAQPLRVLDFGCGTGLSAVALETFGSPGEAILLTGTDRSPPMLRQAAKRGLPVLTQTEWAEQADGAFDAVIASYVIHLGLEPKDCTQIARQLAPGGIFVANYHHGVEAEIARLTALMRRFGLVPLPVPACDCGMPTNPTVLFGRITP